MANILFTIGFGKLFRFNKNRMGRIPCLQIFFKKVDEKKLSFEDWK